MKAFRQLNCECHAQGSPRQSHDQVGLPKVRLPKAKPIRQSILTCVCSAFSKNDSAV